MLSALFHNIISPYKTLLFNALAKDLGGDLHVCYFAETSVLRDWRVEEEKIEYPYVVLNRTKRWEEVPVWKLSLQVLRYAMQSPAKRFIIGEYATLPYWFAWFYGILSGKDIVAILESQEADRKRVFWKEWIKRLFFSKCSHVIVAGEKHKDYVKKLGVSENRIIVMGGVGGVDHTVYDPYREKYHTLDRCRELCAQLGIPVRRYFIYVGRFSPEKNLCTLLRAYAKASCEEYGWGMLMVGAGPQEDELRAYVAEQQLTHVIFSGFIQQDRLPLYYLASKVFILPSLSEPWGLVTDEALALGLPVIVSERCGCVPDIVQHGINGFVFSPEDERAIVRCLQDAMLHADLEKMGKASLAISRQYSPEESARRISDGLRREIS